MSPEMPPSPNMRTRAWIISSIFISFFLLIVVVAALRLVSDASFVHFGDGAYRVGIDIQPGTYRTRTGSPGCSFERRKGFDGASDDIITDDSADGPAIITIATSDKGFTSQSCGTWTSNLSQITTNQTTFGEGTYIIGTDISPGTYRNSGSTGIFKCSYTRLSGFGGTPEGFFASNPNIISSNLVDIPTVVTIEASDRGFQSSNCGTWTKV